MEFARVRPHSNPSLSIAIRLEVGHTRKVSPDACLRQDLGEGLGLCTCGLRPKQLAVTYWLIMVVFAGSGFCHDLVQSFKAMVLTSGVVSREVPVLPGRHGIDGGLVCCPLRRIAVEPILIPLATDEMPSTVAISAGSRCSHAHRRRTSASGPDNRARARVTGAWASSFPAICSAGSGCTSEVVAWGRALNRSRRS